MYLSQTDDDDGQEVNAQRTETMPQRTAVLQPILHVRIRGGGGGGSVPRWWVKGAGTQSGRPRGWAPSERERLALPAHGPVNGGRLCLREMVRGQGDYEGLCGLCPGPRLSHRGLGTGSLWCPGDVSSQVHRDNGQAQSG